MDGWLACSLPACDACCRAGQSCCSPKRASVTQAEVASMAPACSQLGWGFPEGRHVLCRWQALFGDMHRPQQPALRPAAPMGCRCMCSTGALSSLEQPAIVSHSRRLATASGHVWATWAPSVPAYSRTAPPSAAMMTAVCEAARKTSNLLASPCCSDFFKALSVGAGTAAALLACSAEWSAKGVHAALADWSSRS